MPVIVAVLLCIVFFICGLYFGMLGMSKIIAAALKDDPAMLKLIGSKIKEWRESGNN